MLSVKKGIYLTAFIGIIVCWVVLCLFSRAIGSYWGPVLYSVFSTLLQGIFCLGTNIRSSKKCVTYLRRTGLIYDMDPYQMPRAFCTGERVGLPALPLAESYCPAQTFIIYYSAWSLTGVCAAFTFATSSSVLWPSSTKRPGASYVTLVQPSTVARWMMHSSRMLAWKRIYCLPIFAFPLVCLCVSVPVLLHIDAIQPTEDLHCDASKPEW